MVRNAAGVNARRRRLLVLGAAVLVAILAVSLGMATAAWAPPASCRNGSSMYIAAHEDDTILFMNPDLLHDIQARRCVRTVFVTAGDADAGQSYWSSREQGAEAAYAEMAGVADTCSVADAGIPGHPMPLVTLSGAPRISIVFMRLPNSYSSLMEKLYTGAISRVTAVDGSSSYTRPDLTSTLTSLMKGFNPDWIGTHDFVGSFGDGDHSDHYAVAYFVRDAHRAYSTRPHTLVGFMGYPVANKPANVAGSDFIEKDQAWLAYAAYDNAVCHTDAACQQTSYWAWLARQYTVGSEVGGPGVTYPPIADAGPDQIVAGAATGQLDGSGSIATGTPSYRWTQTSGPAVTLSSSAAVKPTFIAPAGAATTLTFQLVVTDGQMSSQPDTVTINVYGPTSNLAPLAAVVTASSENASTGQQAVKAVDGVIAGYPADPTAEWATVGGGAGSWLKLAWTSAVTVDEVVLYDRPNLADQVTGGTLRFSDGSTVAVPALANGGGATTVTFPAVSTSSLLLTITSVSPTTRNIGLAEIQVDTGS
jgi:LmbE family N-acetylglucosaminyl deacetylase